MEESIDELTRLLSSQQTSQRLEAMDRISTKTGRGIKLMVDDDRVVALLMRGLSDSDRMVQRAAARGLRPWIARDPTILDAALTVYATDQFDGTYTHAGLYDTRNGAIWIPKFQATKGHAALLRDGNTDFYFKFDFYLPGQAPQWIPNAQQSGHLIEYIIPEWSYQRQELVPDFDERRTEGNRRQQERYGLDVQRFYRDASLAYDVRVHIVVGGGGHDRSREIDIARIECAPGG